MSNAIGLPSHLEYAAARIHYADDGCWNWTGTIYPRGYGDAKIGGIRTGAHRFVYTLNCGPIPEGLELDHLCRNRRCVNPEHLEPVTRRVNVLRSQAMTAQQARQSHCVHGHEFSPENTAYRKGRYGRICRTCQREARRRSRAQGAA